MASNGGVNRLGPPVTLSSLSQAVESSRLGPQMPARAPPAPDLSATYMPSEGDLLGEGWTNVSPRERRDEPRRDGRPGASRSNTVSTERSYANRGASPLPASSAAGPSSIQDSPSRSERANSREEGDDRERRPRSRRPPSQKAMLAKALEKANHAVVLDNSQNFDQAMTAYHEACDLLFHVMERTNAEVDKNKLETIRSTYIDRIDELKTNELADKATSSTGEKALPAVPQSMNISEDPNTTSPGDDVAETSRQLAADPDSENARLHPRAASREPHPPRRQSLSPASTPFPNESDRRVSPDRQRPPLDGQRAPSPRKLSVPAPAAPLPALDTRNLTVPMGSRYAPAPLSPRRLNEPMTLPPVAKQAPSQGWQSQSPARGGTPAQDGQKGPEPVRLGHVRTETAGSTSWLDPTGESGASSSSSMRSVDSMEDLRRGYYRRGSGTTEAEFDSALDAAIEAAYDQGLEPMSDEDMYEHEALTMARTVDHATAVQKNIDRARQAVREAEREAAIALAKDRERQRRLENPTSAYTTTQHAFDKEYNSIDMEAEAEERLLENASSGFIMEEPGHYSINKTQMPRQSDSSSFSARTWQSSMGSMPTSIGTPLSTVDETMTASALAPSKKPTLAPISTNFSSGSATTLPAALPAGSQPQSHGPQPPPPIPKQQPPEPPLSAALQSPGVRERRLSGQKAKALKIDTGRPTTGLGGAPNPLADAPKSATLLRDHLDAPASGHQQSFLLQGPRTASPFSGRSPGEPLSGTRDRPGSSRDAHHENRSATPGSPGRSVRGTLKKNFSSTSLKSAKSTDDLPGTPLGRVFSAASHRKENIPSMPDLPPNAPHNFARSLTTGSMSFFDNDMHSPDAPGSPNPFYANPPMPLEPCPEVTTLRPFWLMRAIYQTIAHPRGGYLSRRLFVPRDVWRVKNVKLKYVDDKVAQLDLLTAGLMNLSKVDTLDADAVLDVMQSFELLLEQVQGVLAKKLGAEVGFQGASALLKGSPVVDDHGIVGDVGAKDKNSKSYLSGWRKRRNKSTGPGAATLSAGKDASRDGATMKSLPMTPLMNVKFIKRDPTKVLGIGPHAHYMAALARLCDAVQIVDQIARQVEDPGLKFSSKAHVGLELSTKHAAEFFGFYVCRFALTDIGMMLDKFVKRGSEWVMG